MKPTIGRVVHYRLNEEFEGDERWRAALVVNAWPGNTHCNLTVFLDAGNDLRDGEQAEALSAMPGVLMRDGDSPFLHVLSASEGTAPGCWRWPPRD